MSFDVARVRGLYPTLGGGIAYLDGNFSALLPETVIRAIITTLRSSPSQPGSQSARSQRAAASLDNARRAIGDLIGVPPDCVVFGSNVSVLMEQFAALIAREWQLGDEIVISRLDHDGTVRPWLTAAKTVGAIVRWAEVDVETGELPEWQYDRLISRRTRLVTVPLANLATGAIPNARRIADLAHAVGALVVVDAGAALPHLPLDLAELGCDLIGVPVEGFGGPTVGAMIAREGLLYELDEDSTAPVPGRYELGDLPVELLDGVVAAVDHLASLDEWATGSRRQRLVASLRAAGEYERSLFALLDRRLRAMPGVTLLGSPTNRVPLVSFAIDGRKAFEIGDYLKSRGISVWTGPSGMSLFMSTFGADELGGTVHVGLMPHTTRAEIEQLARALDEFV
ncbi:MAG TPA: aminotransferase class V-fold PLP-dependent enzyme [Jatrophihabitantaceae bacterium]|jgi:cysteine desulfurase family protein (TIGR01976 family)